MLVYYILVYNWFCLCLFVSNKYVCIFMFPILYDPSLESDLPGEIIPAISSKDIHPCISLPEAWFHSNLFRPVRDAVGEKTLTLTARACNLIFLLLKIKVMVTFVKNTLNS